MKLLLVEDNEGHARLIEKNLRRANLANPMFVVRDGQEALDYIHGEGRHKGITHEGHLLVLLDLNLPAVDGFEVLRRLKSNRATSKIPVVVLTTTDDEREMEKCYELGCNLYITKPTDYDQFCIAMQKLGEFLPVMTVPSGR